MLTDDNENWKKFDYALYIDGRFVHETDDFIFILTTLMQSYFVFNRLWPKEVACSMEFMQIRFLHIFEERTRSYSKKCTAKAVTFDKKLSQIDSREI